MATGDRLREIQRLRVSPSQARETHYSRIDLPANKRAMLWVLGAVLLAGSLVGTLQWSSYSATLTYSQDQINAWLVERFPVGPGETKIRQASVYISSGHFQIDAVASNDTYQTSLAMTGQLRFEPLKGHLLSEPDNTETATPVKHGREIGDDAADFVSEDWKIIQAVARTAANFATGETLRAITFEQKANRALWDMPVFELPPEDRRLLRNVTVDAVLTQPGGILLQVSDRRMTPAVAFCLILLAGSATLLLMLRAYPDLARG